MIKIHILKLENSKPERGQVHVEHTIDAGPTTGAATLIRSWSRIRRSRSPPGSIWTWAR